MKRFAALAAGCILLSGCGKSGEAVQLPEKGVSIDGTAVRYVQQEGTTYLFLADLLENGFYLDSTESGMQYLPEGDIYYFALWTAGGHEGLEREPAANLYLEPDALYQVYINGLQIACYAAGNEPMVSAEDLAAIPSVGKAEGGGQGTAVLYDADGSTGTTMENVECISPMKYQTLDGEPETGDCFQFESCSAYLVAGAADAEHGRIGLHILQKGEMLETAKGSFPLEGIFAGDNNGVKLIEMTDGYAKFSNALERMGLAYRMQDGFLEIEGKGNGRPCQIDEPEAVQSLPYYRKRLIKTSLEIDGEKQVACYYSGRDLYVAREDLKTKQLLKANGYAYEDYVFYPE